MEQAIFKVDVTINIVTEIFQRQLIPMRNSNTFKNNFKELSKQSTKHITKSYDTDGK